MYEFDASLVWDDLLEIDKRISASFRRVLVPLRWPSPEFPHFHELDEVSVEQFCWWLSEHGPEFRVKATPLADYIIPYGSEVLRCEVPRRAPQGELSVHFKYDDMTEVEPGLEGDFSGRWEPASPAFLEMVQLVKATLRELCFPGEDRMLYSKRLVAQLLATPDPPEWALRYRRRLTKQAAPADKPAARDYESSFAFVREQVGLEGSPRPRVRRRPQYDDGPPGPSLFRTAVADQRFERIELPGLYIGRSEMSDVSFAGAKLYRSTFNWSDFVNVDFSGCDMHDSDLRACHFERCSFAGANLERCDLRGSAFAECTFDGAKVDEALGLQDQRGELALSDAQATSMNWTSEHEEPPGG